MKQLRFFIAEKLLWWAYNTLPDDSKEKVDMCKLVYEYSRLVAERLERG
jgi:hypothetical protein